MHGEEAVDMRVHAFSKKSSALSEPISLRTKEGKLLFLYCHYS